MKAHLAAIRTRMAVAYPVDLWVAEPGRQGQYAILEAPAWDADPDGCLAASTASFATEVRLKAVTATPEGVAIMLANARAVLPGVLTVTGRRAEMQWLRSEFIGADDSVTDPTTGRHPALGVDSYLLASTPLEGS